MEQDKISLVEMADGRVVIAKITPKELLNTTSGIKHAKSILKYTILNRTMCRL